MLIETPSNPLLRITDLRFVIEAAHRAGALAVVDNTFLSPALQKPIAFGADVVVHSTTKYVGGHSDVVGGALDGLGEEREGADGRLELVRHVDDEVPPDRLEAPGEVGLQLPVVLHPVPGLEFPDARARVPLLPVDLVPPDVEIPVGEERGHFSDEGVEVSVDFLPARVHGGIEDTPGTLDMVGARGGGQFRIGRKPGGGVSRHFEFGEHADAPVARVGHDGPDLFLGIVLSFPSDFVQAGEAAGLHSKPLVVGQVPVKDVHLHGGHGVQVS